MNDDARLQADAADIERLLDDLHGLVAAPVWQRIDQVLRRIVALYGAGLGRALDVARRAGAEADRLRDLVTEDDLLASLLVLHGLHPLATEERVERALASVRTELGLGEGALVLVKVEEQQVHLRANASIGGGAMSERLAEGVIRRAIEAVAPEVTATHFEGLVRPRDPGLVQIRTARRAP